MVAVDHLDALSAAEAVLRHELGAIDLACSRFRADSELQRVHAAAGRPVRVRALLHEAISVACAVAERTGGAVDPTVGHAVEALGYDCDFADVEAFGEPLRTRPVPAPGWWLIDLDNRTRSVAVPAGVSIDLGATAKALVADRAACRIATTTNFGRIGLRGWRCGGCRPTPGGRMARRDRRRLHGTLRGRSGGIGQGRWARQLQYGGTGLAPGRALSPSHRRPGHGRQCQSALAPRLGGGRQLC